MFFYQFCLFKYLNIAIHLNLNSRESFYFLYRRCSRQTEVGRSRSILEPAVVMLLQNMVVNRCLNFTRQSGQLG